MSADQDQWDDEQDEQGEGREESSDETSEEDGSGPLAIYEPPGSKEPRAEPEPEEPQEPAVDIAALKAECDRSREQHERISRARTAVGLAAAQWATAKETASRLKVVYEEAVAHLLDVIDDEVEPTLYDGVADGPKREHAVDAWQDADIDAMNAGGVMSPSIINALRDAGLDTYRKIGEWCQRNRLSDAKGVGKGKAEKIQVALDAWAAKHAKVDAAEPDGVVRARECATDYSPQAEWRATPLAKLGLPKRVADALIAVGIDAVGKLDDASCESGRLNAIPQIRAGDVSLIDAALDAFHRHVREQQERQDDDAWRSEPIGGLDLPAAIVQALSDAGITTLGELEAFRARKPLADIQRIGEKSVELIEAALLAYWAKRGGGRAAA